MRGGELAVGEWSGSGTSVLALHGITAHHQGWPLLADALPDLDHDSLARLQEGKVRHRSLKNGKGALRKKEKIVRGEVERFGISLARLNSMGAAVSGGDGAEVQGMQVEEDQSVGADGSLAESGNAPEPQPPSSTANRWAALRGFISATMEQNPAFLGNKEDGK